MIDVTELGTCLYDEPLAPYTSWRIGGRARCVFKPNSLKTLQTFLRYVSSDEPILVLGLGSNTLISDDGFPGTVIIMQGALTDLEQTPPLRITAQAGVACARLARFAARSSLAGCEFMAGIPGTVGGALAMNAGCFGSQTWEWVESVTTLNRQGELTQRMPDTFEIHYREVNGLQGEWFVKATFLLQPGDKQTSLDKIRTLLDTRSQTQPTGDHSCGSVFRNPPDDHAARLIEACGLKAYRIGGAQISEKHANFIINLGSATAEDIKKLIVHARETVFKKHGVWLQPEVHMIEGANDE